MNLDREFRIGQVEFGEPTILILGTPTSFEWLSQQIASRQSLLLKDRSGGAKISIVSSENHSVLSGTRAALELAISATHAPRFAKQFAELARNATPAHIYIDVDTNNVGAQLMASCGEYDAESVFT